MAEKKLFLVNVLSPEYYNDCHIPGSINVPLNQIEGWGLNIDRDAKIVVYCSSYNCSASQLAWHLLHNMGFVDLWTYEGGMNEWYNAGDSIADVCQQQYLSKPVSRPDKAGSGLVREICLDDLRKAIAESRSGIWILWYH